MRATLPRDPAPAVTDRRGGVKTGERGADAPERGRLMLDPVRRAWRSVQALLAKIEWTGPLLVRLTLGLVFIPTGWGKLHHLDHVAQFFAQLGIPAPHVQAAIVATIELVGGTLVLVGLATRVASALLVGVMTVAILTAKLPELHGLTDLAGTIELAYLVMLAWLAVAGAGAASLDRAASRLAGRHHTLTPS
jgi:putative oxidoreductase